MRQPHNGRLASPTLVRNTTSSTWPNLGEALPSGEIVKSRLFRCAAAAFLLALAACGPNAKAPLQCTAGQLICNAGNCNNLATGFSNCDLPDGGPGPAKDLVNDPQNCGSCGNACSASEACKNGGCDPCPVARCGNNCVDTQHDPANCGACGA